MPKPIGLATKSGDKSYYEKDDDRTGGLNGKGTREMIFAFLGINEEVSAEDEGKGVAGEHMVGYQGVKMSPWYLMSWNGS